MKNKIQFYGVCIMLLIGFRASAKNDSIESGKLWPDNQKVHINAHGGGILFHKGRYYWFGEHKTKGSGGNVANIGVHCYSSRDLCNWKDEGIALKVAPDNSGVDIEKGCIIERPKVIYNRKTGKFVMWFHLEKKNCGYENALSGVAVGNKITGPYTYLKSVRPNAGFYPTNFTEAQKNVAPVNKVKYNGWNLPENIDSLNILGRDIAAGQMARDMTLFVDDDQKAYHIYASEENSTLHIAELTDDYLSHTGRYIRCFSGRFMEAPAMFKSNSKYYLMMSGCTGWKPNKARSAVADSVLGNWEERGNPCLGKESETTFRSQSSFIFPVQGKKNAFIYMGDRWSPDDAIDGRYVWLPVKITDDRFIIEWKEKWSLDEFTKE